MNETQKALLEKGIIILPNEIGHDAYEMIAEALLSNPDREIKMYCAGDGGSPRDGFAIVDLVQAHGQVVGMLAGLACSAHSFIWTSCAKRFVYPHGAIGVHKIGYSELNRALDSRTAQQHIAELEMYERWMAKLYAGDAQDDSDSWYKVIQEAGRDEYMIFPAEILVKMGMARDVGELKLTPPQHPLPTGLPSGAHSQARGEGLENGNEAVTARTWTSMDALKNL